MSAENQIRKASDKFYAALNCVLNGDWTPMADVWSRNPDVSTMHPAGGTQVGWDEIRASWENLAKICSNGRVELRDQRISVGEDLAYETGTEHVFFAERYLDRLVPRGLRLFPSRLGPRLQK